MNIKGGQMLTLNPTGSIIWQQLADGASPEQIADRLSSEFGIPREQALADVNEFLEQARKPTSDRALGIRTSPPKSRLQANGSLFCEFIRETQLSRGTRTKLQVGSVAETSLGSR